MSIEAGPLFPILMANYNDDQVFLKAIDSVTVQNWLLAYIGGGNVPGECGCMRLESFRFVHRKGLQGQQCRFRGFERESGLGRQ